MDFLGEATATEREVRNERLHSLPIVCQATWEQAAKLRELDSRVQYWFFFSISSAEQASTVSVSTETNFVM